MDQLVNSVIGDPRFLPSLAAVFFVLLVLLVVTLWPKRRKPAPRRRVPQPRPAVVHHPDNDVTYPLFRRDEQVRREVLDQVRAQERERSKPRWVPNSENVRELRKGGWQ